MAEQLVGTDVNQIEITSLNHINGQPQVQDVLRVSIDAYFQQRAANENSSFGPAILLGPSGVGKTLTAKAIHCELANLKLIESNGEMLNGTAEMMSALLSADNNTTIFIDECQALSSKAQHLLLTAIIIPDLIKLGVNMLAPQFSCMTFEQLGQFKGQVCFVTDIDRQNLLSFGTPEEVVENVIGWINALASPEGGIIGRVEIASGVSRENAEAVYKTFYEFRF